MLAQPLGVQPAGHENPLGVIRDGDVFQAPLAGRRGHLLQGVLAVGRRGVHVQVAANVLHVDQLGQLTLFGPLEFAAVLAQLGRKDGQVERGVNVLSLAPATYVSFSPSTL